MRRNTGQNSRSVPRVCPCVGPICATLRCEAKVYEDRYSAYVWKPATSDAERLFSEYINRKNSAKLRRELNMAQKELDAMRRRNTELTALFKRLYEDNVLGHVTNEQFRILSGDYNTEQKELAAAIPEKEARLQKLKDSAANVEAFIEKAKRYTEIPELTPEILQLSSAASRSGNAVKNIPAPPSRRSALSTATWASWTAWSRLLKIWNRQILHKRIRRAAAKVVALYIGWFKICPYEH